MMKKLLICIFLITIFVFFVRCVDDLNYKNNTDSQIVGITKKEAVELFQQKIIDYEKLKQKGNVPKNSLLPDNYTPQWNNAVNSENEYIWSIEAPIISSKRLEISHRRDKQPWRAAVNQKLVIIKSKETKDMEMFVLTLIPDKDCFHKHRHYQHRGRTYTHAGNKQEFSGIAVYTLWEGTNILINEHNSDSVTQRFKYDRGKSFYSQKNFSNAVIGETGELVLMSDNPGGGDIIDIEGIVVIAPGIYCPWCGNYKGQCTCYWDPPPGPSGGGSGGYDDGGDYFPPGYPDPGGGGGNPNPPPSVKYTVTISISGDGTVTGYGTSTSNINGVGVYEYNKGTYIGISAVANTGYKFTGWQGDVSGTSTSIWIENISKNMSVTANFTSKAEPYSARSDDKFFKTVFDTIMEKQMPNSCATTVMVYISKLLCNKTVDENKYIKRYNRKYKKWAIIDGVESDNLPSFLSQYFVLGSFTSYSAAIDAGKVVFATVPASGGGHAVLVVGYGADGSLLYMDPTESSLMRSDSDFPFSSYRFVINKCD
jgi:uncharacterized repeat protein (TIGR02543 family)